MNRGAFRHGFAIALALLASYPLNQWYKFQQPASYLTALLLLGMSGVLLSRTAVRFFPRLTAGRVIILFLLFLLAIPLSEYINMDFDWTRQLFHQFLFVYFVALLSSLLPNRSHSIDSRVRAFLQFCSSKGFIFWILPIVFFMGTSWMSLFVLKRIPLIVDSASYLFQAQIFSKFHLTAPAPQLSEFFSTKGDLLAMQNGKWFSVFPPGFSLLLAAAMKLKLEWILCPALGSLSIFCWMFYAKRWHSKDVAILLGILCLLSPFLFLMSSTSMVHVPELFLVSVAIYLCRRETEKPAFYRALLVSLFLFFGVLVRYFSVLSFLGPILVYTCWSTLKKRRLSFTVTVLSGIVLGFLALGYYQLEQSGNFWEPGIFLEYPHLHGASIARDSLQLAIVNLTNNFHSLNTWLTGWMSGAVFFLLIFICFNSKIQFWDKLLCASAFSLAFFYTLSFLRFSSVIYNIVLGPRFYFVLSPFLLLLIARAILEEKNLPDSFQQGISSIFAISILVFLPLGSMKLVQSWNPAGSYEEKLVQKTNESPPQKLLIFLDERVPQHLVNWNNPFLSSSIIISRDLNTFNSKIESRFSDHKVIYLRPEKGIQRRFGFYETPDRHSGGEFSFFDFAMILQTSNDIPERDMFDLCYSQFFYPLQASASYDYLEEQSAREVNSVNPDFRNGLIAMAKMALLPLLALHHDGSNWSENLNVHEFRGQYLIAKKEMQDSGEIGRPLLQVLGKTEKRIDRDADQKLSEEEILRFLSRKLRPLQQRWALFE